MTESPKCKVCGVDVTEDCFCSGCNNYVCEDCDLATPVGIHDLEDHDDSEYYIHDL